MEKYFEKCLGKNFPVRYVWLPEDMGGIKAKIADFELWDAISDYCERGDREYIDLDNTIFFYCDSGFIASNPTDEEIIDYLKMYV